MKNLQISKNKNKNLKSSGIEPENNNFRLKNPIETTFQISGMKKHSFFADTKLQVDHVKKKMEENFVKPLFIKQSIIFKS